METVGLIDTTKREMTGQGPLPVRLARPFFIKEKLPTVTLDLEAFDPVLQSNQTEVRSRIFHVVFILAILAIVGITLGLTILSPREKASSTPTFDVPPVSSFFQQAAVKSSIYAKQPRVSYAFGTQPQAAIEEQPDTGSPSAVADPVVEDPSQPPVYRGIFAYIAASNRGAPPPHAPLPPHMRGRARFP